MKTISAARLRAVGLLLLEAAGIALVIAQHIGRDQELKATVNNLVKKARSL